MCLVRDLTRNKPSANKPASSLRGSAACGRSVPLRLGAPGSTGGDGLDSRPRVKPGACFAREGGARGRAVGGKDSCRTPLRPDRRGRLSLPKRERRPSKNRDRAITPTTVGFPRTPWNWHVRLGSRSPLWRRQASRGGRIRKQALEGRGPTASGRCWSGGPGTLPGPHGAVALLKGRAGREAGTCGESWVGVG